MANWTDHGEVFRVPRDLSVNNQAYAPGAAVKNGKVYLYVPDGGSKIGAAYADRPEGPFEGGKSLITGNAGNNTNVPWLFDPMGFVDDDGQGYIYFGGGPSDGNPGPGQNLRGAKLNADMMSVQYPATTISDTRCSFEAAYVHKRGSTYYFSYSTNFSCNTTGVQNGTIAYLTSDNPLTGFTYKGIMLGGTSGNNHASPVEYKDKWYLFYHDRKLKSKTNANERPAGITTDGEKRSVAVDLLEYESNGNIKQVTMTNAGPAQIKNLNPFDTVRATTMNLMYGINTDSVANGGMVVTQISNNDWVRLKGVDFGSGATRFTARAASNTSGSSIELRTGSNTGTLIGTCNIASTGGLTTFSNFECDITNATGVKDFLYLVFKGGSGAELFRLAWYKFDGGTAPSSSATPSSSSIVPSSSSLGPPQECAYQTSWCGGMEFVDVTHNTAEMPATTGECVYISDFYKIQPSLESTIAINGLENTCGDEWGDEPGGPCQFNTKPAAQDGGYYVFVKTGDVNGYIPEEATQPNGWQGVVAGSKLNCTSFATPSSSSSSEESTPILLPQTNVVRALRATPLYYNLKGEPLGNAKPSNPGIYIEKNGKQVKKIVVR
uniref:Endo-1,4-beta-xylanase A n=1 Tax=uncultured bacterium contig00177 TaxID=1181599 RepID=A0A806KL60_9BACT|nr:endo-1,4-beta-xylanase A precursor [uncultured bacterium contig00177]